MKIDIHDGHFYPNSPEQEVPFVGCQAEPFFSDEWHIGMGELTYSHIAFALEEKEANEDVTPIRIPIDEFWRVVDASVTFPIAKYEIDYTFSTNPELKVRSIPRTLIQITDDIDECVRVLGERG